MRDHQITDLTFQAENGDTSALAHLSTLAQAGDVLAMRNLGCLYDEPQSGKIGMDLEKARHWYEQAALQGDMLSQMALGNIFDYGQGGEQNLEKARKLVFPH